MRTKKYRKNRLDSPFANRLWNVGGPALFKIKFDTSLQNISCFMQSKPPSIKFVHKKNSITPRRSKSISKGKSCHPTKNQTSLKKIIKQKENKGTQDVFLECTNSIIEKIEEKGINFVWQDQQEQNQNADIADMTIWSAFNEKSCHEKSFASTNDFPHYHTVGTRPEYLTYSNLWSPLLQTESERQSAPLINTFQIQVDSIQKDWRTTLMIRNIPNKYTIHDLCAQIDAHLPNTYDFLYLPCDFKNQCNVGYGFINFIETQYLQEFYYKFNMYHWKKYRSEKICALTYARLQGLNQLIEHFQNSKVLNQKDKKYRPIIRYDKIHKMVLQQQGR